MESKPNKYQLTQKSGTYILYTSIVGNEIKITVENSSVPNSAHSRTYSVDTWKRIGAVFESINSAQDAIQWIDNAMKVHKVKIVEEGSLVKLIFAITESNKTRHFVQIPISGDNTMASSSINTNISAASFVSGQTAELPQTQVVQQDYSQYQSQQYMQQAATTTNTTTTTTTTNAQFNINEFGIDPSKVVKSTVNPNTDDIIKSIESEQKLRLSQVGKLTTENYVPEVKVDIPFKVVETPVQEQTTNTFTDTTTTTATNFDLNQFTTTAPETTTNTFTDTTTTTNFDLNQFNTTDTSASQFNFEEYKSTTTPNITNQYTETNTQITSTVNAAPATSYSSPYITPADDFPATTTTETIPVESYTQNNNEINFGEYQATTTTTTTDTQFNTQDFTNTQFTEFDSGVPDDKLFKLEGDAINLKNEHQEIQYKLTNLTNQVSLYKNQLEFLEKEKNNRELSALRAENAQIKQQLSELNNLRKAASEVQVLREKVAQLDPLRRKAAEADSLKGQLNELHMLRMKVAELSGMQNQLGELNNLKAQVGQMNLMKQQMDELNMLKAKVEELSRNNLKTNDENDEKEMLKRKLQELESLKSEYEQEIRTLRENKTTVATKDVQENSGLEKKQLLFEERAQQISVKGDIIHSTEELELITRKINKGNKKITLNLLYKATVDSDKAEAFHDKCDQAQSSLVLIETDKGKRFGGFTSCSWAGECIDKKDEDAFIFSLDKMSVYENIPGEDAIGCYPKFGPIFLGCQIRIYDNSFAKGGTTFEKGLNYNTEEDFELTGGERIFGVKEIEVYEVIAQ
jgi:hypothetical protein